MALQVFIAHTGRRLHAEPGSFASLDAFRSWVAKYGAVSVQNQICLTAQGKAVRAQTLLTEQEIFIYNRQVIQASPSTSAKPSTSQIPMPNRFEVENPPDTISDQNNLQAWKDLFMARRTWALELVNECASMSDTAQQRYSEMDVITRSVGAAVVNLQTHVQSLDQKCSDARSWASEVSRDHQSLMDNWEGSLTQLRLLPATAPMVRFIVGHDPRRGKQHACLEDLIDPEEVKKAGDTAKKAAGYFTRNVSELGRVMDDLVAGTDKVFEKADNGVARSTLQRSGESVQLMEDIEAIAKKVNSDYESILGYTNTPKSVSQASKSALLHTKNFLPNIKKRSLEMADLLRHATDIRNQAAVESVEIMQAIASLNSICTEVADRLESLEVAPEDDKAFALLQLVQQLPAVYASFVAEAVRRREWSDKIKSDSSTLANEMATFQDEEERRRKKWQKSTGALFWTDKTEGKAMGLEVNLLGDDEQWPLASRQNLEELLQVLHSQNARSDVIRDVSQTLSDLNNPTKQQSKRVKAFKNGSFHEAAMGRSALLVRGDDDLIRSLQEQNTKIQGKLKGSESRVRRLEDLLHRQSVITRSSTGNVFQAPSTPITDRPDLGSAFPSSPRLTDHPSRPSSAASRRFSSNNNADEKALAQRLVALEAELIAERERAAGLEKEVSARATVNKDIKGQVAEANSTKKDLMENLEAQQREFSAERQSLESEIKRLKTKIEEYEDDMDRILGSRENEKTQVDERVRLLQHELERLRTETAAETQKAQGQVDFLRNDAKLQRESNEKFERQLQRANEETRELKTRAERAESSEAEQLSHLRDLHTFLMPSTNLPSKLGDLVEGVLSKLSDIVEELDLHKRDLEIVRHDRDAAQATVTDLRAELAGTKDELSNEEKTTSEFRETIDAERAKFRALENELADERDQLTLLRAKFAEGETGSEALRIRIMEEEGKVALFSEQLAASQSRVGSLEEELRSTQERLHTAQAKFEKLSGRFEARTQHAKDLTQRLYTQNDRLIRLLDRLSYSVSREGSSMVIQKIPRMERSSANDSSDPSSSMRRSISGAMTKALADSADLELLYWMQNEDIQIEAEKYEAFLKAIGYFDIEAFSEIITKRVKDIEHTARKYTKDARAYREKSHHAQKEAHEKIAFKNFKEGDLALFLPTRNQAAGAWAAFNVGAPHYFLREQDSHRLRTRDWLLARIQRIEDRVVDLSKSMGGHHSNVGDRGSIGEASNGGDSFEDDNPFDLSDGLRWYLIDAVEEKPGAPSTPGLGKSTVATTSVDATGSIRQTKKSLSSGVDGVSKTLSRSLDSRRSSSNSKKAVPVGPSTPKGPPSLSDIPKSGTANSGEPSSETIGVVTPVENRPDVSLVTNKPPPPLRVVASNLTQENPTTSTGTSPGKKSVIWDSLWSLDLSLESGKTKK